MNKIKTEKLRLAFDNLPDTFDNFRISVLADFHLGRMNPLRLTRESIDISNSLEPDIVLIPGDFFYGYKGVWVHERKKWENFKLYAGLAIEQFSRIKSKYGTYCILGNHDIWTGRKRVMEVVEKSGIEYVADKCISIEKQGQKIFIIGIEERTLNHAKLDALLKDVPEDGFVIFLGHSPDVFEDIEDRRVKLVLAGHTHGGQVAFPFVGPLIVPSKYWRKYASGLFRRNGRVLYVSRGIGYSGLPVRVFSAPEVTLIELGIRDGS